MNRDLLIALIAGVALAQQTGCVPAGPARPLFLTCLDWLANPDRHPIVQLLHVAAKKGVWW